MSIERITPKLVVLGADAAIEFYAQAFGAEVDMRFAMDGAVVFAELRIGEATIQVKDEDEVDKAPPTRGGTAVVLDLATDSPDALTEQAVAAGAEVIFPVADQFYGARQGRVRDPFGHEWIIGAPMDLSPEEIQALIDG